MRRTNRLTQLGALVVGTLVEARQRFEKLKEQVAAELDAEKNGPPPPPDPFLAALPPEPKKFSFPGEGEEEEEEDDDDCTSTASFLNQKEAFLEWEHATFYDGCGKKSALHLVRLVYGGCGKKRKQKNGLHLVRLVYGGCGEKTKTRRRTPCTAYACTAGAGTIQNKASYTFVLHLVQCLPEKETNVLDFERRVREKYKTKRPTPRTVGAPSPWPSSPRLASRAGKTQSAGAGSPVFVRVSETSARRRTFRQLPLIFERGTNKRWLGWRRA
eukprot:1179657-Prorocentrum_minimum.AAC.2